MPEKEILTAAEPSLFKPVPVKEEVMETNQNDENELLVSKYGGERSTRMTDREDLSQISNEDESRLKNKMSKLYI